MTEAALAEKEPEAVHVHVPVIIRRFSTADLSQHGGWILKRLQPMFADCSEQWIAGWMRGLIGNNEHLFLYQPHAVALFQAINSPGLRPAKMVQERFVWVEDKSDSEQIESAADFYDYVADWGRGLRAERIIACESTDVPKPKIEERLGRLFNTTISHARL